ncbi:MAG: OFA family MFS transporter [Streptococcaceae bacterium]|jgi:OFA family oxalate/formate antiporter-like MFS transporter|nr:OFA family MFS transporter [Streptococcaceae bacterium]
MEKKWIHAAIPALLIHMSIGSVYTWSIFKTQLAQNFGRNVHSIEWAFSLAIFFLGMSAAFLGPFVEKDLKRSAYTALFFFVSGFIMTGVSVQFHFLPGLYIFYGIMMGIGLGIGYLTPIKNLMLWYSDQKGLATGIAVAGFGLAKVICAPVMEFLIATVGITMMFYILGGIYFVMMLLGAILVKRPPGYVYNIKKSKVPRLSILKKKDFLPIWFMFYLNITSGLALISQEKDILKMVLVEQATPEVRVLQIVAVVIAMNAFFNTAGRLFFSSFSDKLPFRETSYQVLFVMSISACLLYLIFSTFAPGVLWPVMLLLFLVNAGYGGGFSTLPVLLDQHFGMETISTVHGLVLSAWAIAGLTGNQLSALLVHTWQLSYTSVISVVLVMYLVALAAVSYVKHL